MAHVIEFAQAECDRLVKYGFSDLELHRAKEQLKGSLMLSLESTANRMSQSGKERAFDGVFLTPDELIRELTPSPESRCMPSPRRF